MGLGFIFPVATQRQGDGYDLASSHLALKTQPTGSITHSVMMLTWESVLPGFQCCPPSSSSTGASSIVPPGGKKIPSTGVMRCECLGLRTVTIITTVNKGLSQEPEQATVNRCCLVFPAVHNGFWDLTSFSKTKKHNERRR